MAKNGIKARKGEIANSSASRAAEEVHEQVRRLCKRAPDKGKALKKNQDQEAWRRRRGMDKGQTGFLAFETDRP